MNWKTTLSLFGAGVIGGVVISKALASDKLSPEQALKKVKAAAKQNHELDGAWIQLTPEHYIRDGLNFSVYKGGLTVNESEGMAHYDFVADAKTGSILEFAPQT